MEKGKFIVFYGVNNLGKSTQAKLLVERLNKEGRKAKYLKYAVYGLEPSGNILNAYLREGNPYKLSPREFQVIQAYNRAQYEPSLKRDLENGIDIVAEDYWGTGVAWGVGAGVEIDFLLKLNSNFNFEDLAFLFVGKRFESGFEKGHLHESDDVLTQKVDKAHRELAEKFGWELIDANDTIENVSEKVWEKATKIL